MESALHSAAAEAIETPRPDTVTLDIINGKLLAVADEMGLVVVRTSMSPVIYEVLDFACGIVDDKGQVISQANGITVFTGTFAGHVQNILQKFEGRMRPDDIYIANDPYKGGTHNNDVAIIKPVFMDGTLLAFTITVAHWTDIGGKVAGSVPIDGTEIHQEGMRFTGLRIYNGGERAEDLEDVIIANSRLPKYSQGDLNASLAAVRIADTRLQEICAKYGLARTREAFEHILTTSEQLSRAAVRALPDGVYEAEDYIDGDGINEVQVPVKVRIEITGEDITFDFTGSSPQNEGPVNCSRGSLLSAVKTAFKALVGPQEPGNEGWFKPATVIAPEGTVFTATYPAPVGWYFEAACHAAELIWKALAPIAPGRYSAGSYLSLCATYFYGTDPKTGGPFVLVEPHMGGWGASDGRNGANAVVGLMDGDTYNYSVELLEAKFPIRCRRYGLNTEDGVGAGRYHGGYGTVRDYEVLTDESSFYASVGRSVERPWGLKGGRHGTNNYLRLKSGGRVQRVARLMPTKVKAGDVLTIVTGGGGGYGSPATRPEAEVLNDVTDGYLTPEQAHAEYGTVVPASDSEKTEASRAAG